MYTVIKRLEISAAHQLNLSYKSKCENLHGHNWIIFVHLRSEKLNSDGMVCDFTEIKKCIYEKLDHKNLNDIIDQPTAENIAKYICDVLGDKCFKVQVQESEGNIGIYER